MDLEIDTFPVGSFQCNCSIIACPETKEAIIVDAGDDYRRIIAKVKEKSYQVKYLIHTHAHLDHFGATDDIKKALGGETLLHQDDIFLYDAADIQAQMLGLPTTTTSPIDCYLEDEQEYALGKSKLKVLHTPGHTPGSCSFCLQTKKEQFVFSGDTLFQNSVGRTDLPGGDFGKLKKSIRHRLYTLDGDSIVIPGHGDTTTIGEEKINNPFVKK